MKTVILVNGVPASGKSTIAKAISVHFDHPYLSIDVIKEPFMAIHDNIDRAFNREMGKSAYQVIWDTVSDAPDGCTYVIDAWFGFQPKETLEQYLKSAGVDQVIEVWNQISPELVSQRYRDRLPFRKEGHPGEEYIPELAALAERASPMRVGTLISVDQDKGFEMGDLLASIQSNNRTLDVA